MKGNFERPNIRAMKGYVPGEQPSDQSVIKLNTNENPYPPSPTVFQSLAEFDAATLRKYPSPSALAFREAAARHHGVSAEEIIATRGGDELLRLVLTTFVDPGEKVAVASPAYSLYPVLTAIQDGQLEEIELNDEWLPDERFAEKANERGCKVAFIVNPHAPSGTLVSQSFIKTIATTFNGLLVIDEAYVDFVSDATHDLTHFAVEAPNVLLLRTLSKGYGLAGLRFGYGIGCKNIIHPMITKTRDSYNLDAISQALAAAAITDQAYAAGTWAKVNTERKNLSDTLKTMGFEVLPSQGNFVLATVPTGSRTAEQLFEGLKASGVLVRFFNEPRLQDKLRITIGTPEENQRLITSLRTLLEKEG